MLWLWELHPGSTGGVYSAPTKLLTEISNILFETITEMLQGKAILNL